LDQGIAEGCNFELASNNYTPSPAFHLWQAFQTIGGVEIRWAYCAQIRFARDFSTNTVR
jgi:hypothetical protein